MALICGIEEAGRGPVIGPLVMCGVLIDEADSDKLRALGAKDSKMLSPRQRELLYDKIASFAKAFEIIIIPPEEIDTALRTPGDNLNLLEIRGAAKLINKLRPEIAFVDCPSTNIHQFTEDLRYHLLDKSTKIVAEHKADENYPVVSAASIIAKVTRDAEIEKLKKEYKVEFGSGYPADPRTIAFIKDNYDKYPFFRTTWDTWKKASTAKQQRDLKDF